MDKLTLKRLFAEGGLPQVEFAEVGEEGWRERVAEMGSPLWVKPSRLGSSVGISRVEGTGTELDEAVELALRHDPRVIVEASATGREVECSLLGNEDVEASPPGEIVAHADWYDYETKYREGGMELVVPAPIPDEQVARLRELAVERLPARRLLRPRPLRLLRRARRRACSSTRSTRCPASPRPASTRSSGRRPASPIPSSATASSALAVERHERVRSHEF